MISSFYPEIREPKSLQKITFQSNENNNCPLNQKKDANINEKTYNIKAYALSVRKKKNLHNEQKGGTRYRAMTSCLFS